MIHPDVEYQITKLGIELNTAATSLGAEEADALWRMIAKICLDHAIEDSPARVAMSKYVNKINSEEAKNPDA